LGMNLARFRVQLVQLDTGSRRRFGGREHGPVVWTFPVLVCLR